jgi:spore germination protein KC
MVIRAMSLPARSVAVLLVVAAACAPLAGCWDRVELDEQTHVLSGFLDLAPDGSLRLTVEAMGLMGGGGGGGAAPDTHAVFSVTGRGLQEAIWNLRWVAEALPNVAHMGLLVIGEDVARAGLRHVVEALSQSYQVRRTILLAVTPGKAADLLSAGLTASRHTEQLLGMLRVSDRGSGEVSRIRLNNFLVDLGTQGIDPMMARFVLEPPPPVEHVAEHTQAGGGQPRGGGGEAEGGGAEKSPGEAPKAAMNGGGLFVQDRLVAFLERHEALGLNFIRGPLNNFVVWVPTGEGNEGFAANLSQSFPRLRITETGGRLRIECGARIEADLGEYSAAGDIASPEEIAAIGQQISAHIEGMIASGIAYATSYGADPCGFGRYVSRHLPDAWQRLRADWPAALREAELTIKVETAVVASGMHTRKNPLVPLPQAPLRGR